MPGLIPTDSRADLVTASPSEDPPTPGPSSPLRPFEPGVDDAAWDDLVRRSVNGTFLHTRQFLSYHGERFADRSLVLDEGSGLRAVLPAALDPSDRDLVVSHPGITFGGLVHDGSVRGEEMLALLSGAAEHYRGQGAHTFRYKVVPSLFHRSPAADDLYALYRLGATRYRCDLSAILDVERRLPLGRSRHKPARAARNRGVEARWGWGAGSAFWALLGEVLSERHGATPVHSLEEIQILASRFPDEIRLVTAWTEGELVAGAVMFCMSPVMHLQYSASSALGRKVGGTDVVIEEGIARARDEGYRHYDFGTCSEDQGRVLNNGLYEFKLSFGAGSTVFEHYALALSPRAPSGLMPI